jgi:DNA-binding transcriptional ArsR family regulator
VTRPLEHPAAAEFRIADILHALSDPIRLAIVSELQLAGRALNCTETTARLDLCMPKSTCSQHYRILREAGVIASERNGVELNSCVRSADLQARFPGLLDAVLVAWRHDGARATQPNTWQPEPTP